MKTLSRFFIAGFLVLTTPVFAQTSATQVVPGQYATAPQTGCVVGPCFLPVSPTNPLPVTGGGGTQGDPTATTGTNDSGSITTGGTAQTPIASNPSRKGCVIQNPATAADQGIATAENLYVNFTGTAAAASTSFELSPGSSIGCDPWGTGVITSAISVVGATTGHKFIANEFN